MQSTCPKKDICGSCSWSPIPYEKQLMQKLSDINGSFAIKELDLRCESILPSPVTEHYRNRMDFAIDYQGHVGLKEKGKWWKVIDGHGCFLADEQIDELFKAVRDWVKTCDLSFYDRKAHTGLLRYAVIRSTTLEQTMVNIVTSSSRHGEEPRRSGRGDEVIQKILALAHNDGLTTLIWSQNSTITDVSYGDILETLTGPGFIEEEISGHRYRISPNAFFQTNSHGAALLLKTVEEFCGDLSGKTLLDLYCGSGFFSVALAPRASRTVGVEMVPEAIVDARVNAELNHVTIEFHDAKTEDFDWTSLGADVVILDPPRSGMHDKALVDILANPPNHIVYVSCNYKNFAREMIQLQKIYHIDAMRAIDLFPHTPHVELVTKLTRK
ncbi:MAG: 23S rRNA (uracil(1939)-C(5))-methyltransferase RlmD [Candidatus Uhrbacteria bacterium]|nr:23S rRNA (uracil(1939)-C(5))-methyltransferase RlmD [Candidatus Uhrbacteria bacterium]